MAADGGGHADQQVGGHSGGHSGGRVDGRVDGQAGGHADEGKRARRSWTVTLVALACTLAAVAGFALNRDLAAQERPPGTTASAFDEAAALVRLLDRRAAAVLDRDERAFLGVVDAGAAAFRAEQRERFLNLAQVPLSSWSYRLRGTRAFPLPTTGSGRRVAAEVELSYRLEGYDREPVTATEYLTFAERGGHWRIASDSDGERGGRRTDTQLWDLGPVHALRGPRSLVLGLGDQDALRRYADDAERAVPAVNRSWKGPWSRKVVLRVPRSLDQMAALLDSPAASYRGIAAVTTGRPGSRPTDAPADRITVNPDAFGELGDLGRQVVITHETVHVATRADTASWTPLWLSEGVADWIGYRETGRTPAQIAPELSRDVRAGRLPERLPEAAAFGTTRDGLVQAYEMAWLACRMIAERYGQDALVELYRAVGERGRGRGGVDRVMREVLGVGVEGFTRQWRAEIARELA